MKTFSPLLAAGLILAASFTTAGHASGASFACGANMAPDETAICADCDLGQLDVKMATMYQVLTRTSAMGMRGVLQDDQRAWLGQRTRCGADRACIRAAYEARIGQLQKLLDDFYARGPY